MAVVHVPVLEGQRLRLEPLSPAHSQGMFELWRRSEVSEHSGPAVDSEGRTIDLPAASRSESDRLLQYWLDRSRAGTGFRWAVLQRDPLRFAGAVGFNALGTCSEYAYHFVPEFWGGGLAYEASRLAFSWCFSTGSESIEVFIDPGNTRSIRLAERLGFEPSNEAKGGPPRYVLEGARHVA